MPKCNACNKEVRPSELSESFICSKSEIEQIRRYEQYRGKLKNIQRGHKGQ